jgi:DNA-binding transcriptional MerR regulator
MSAERELEHVLSAEPRPIFNIAAVVQRSGVTAATIRAWERRYGFPSPTRGPGNQRLYSEQDIQALIYLRKRLEEGLTISSAVALLREQLAQPVRPSPSTARLPSSLASDLEHALLTFDTAAATAVLSDAFALYPLERVCLDVIQPTLVNIGQGWHEGRLEVAQEHFATAFIRQRLSALLESLSPRGAARRAVAACAPGEWHEVGLLIVSLFLARHGWRVFYLGANLPADGLPNTLALLRPDALVLSASSDVSGESLGEVARLVAELAPPRPLVGFGGQPFEASSSLRDSVPGLYLGPSAATTVERLAQALAERGQ